MNNPAVMLGNSLYHFFTFHTLSSNVIPSYAIVPTGISLIPKQVSKLNSHYLGLWSVSSEAKLLLSSSYSASQYCHRLILVVSVRQCTSS